MHRHFDGSTARGSSVDDLDAARRKRATRLISDAVVVVVVLLGVAAVVQQAGSAMYVVVLGALATFVGCSVLSRGASWRIASFLLVATSVLAPVVAIFTDGTLGSRPIHLVVASLFAAATMTRRGVLATLAATLGSLAFMVWYTRNAPTHVVPDANEIVSTASMLVTNGVAAALLTATIHATLADSKRREARALEDEARYRLFADHTDDLIMLLDAEGKCVYASPSHERILGVDPASILGRPRTDLVVEEDRDATERAFREALDKGRATVLARARRVGDGAIIHLDAVLNAVEHLGGRFVAVAARDVTKQRSLASQLQQAQKMEALGRLAGGVAHDFNNLLTIIQTCTTLASSTRDQAHARELHDEVLMASSRAADLTRQLLSFSRRQVTAPEEIDLRAALTDAVALSKRLEGPGVVVETDIAPDLWRVTAATSQIEQIVLNLASNARDAMPDGGTFRVRAHNADDGNVEIVVSDTGVGMSAETLQHVFEPFFTTKQPGVGTGLGLATCFGIVEQLRGSMKVASEIGKGTTFTILLPRASASVAATTDGPARRDAARPSDEPTTVLVVDDDEAIRTAMIRVVESLGHRALAASSLAEATARARESRVDTLLTDIRLGPDSGIDVMLRIRELHPAAGVVLTSGFVQNAEEVERHLASGAEFLPKPFTPDALRAALVRALGSVRDVRTTAA